MKNILITGSKGFIGKNLRIILKEVEGIKIFELNKESLLDQLDEFLESVDLIYHLAGVNRPRSEQEFFEGNYILTKKIIEKIESKSLKIPIVFASSTQAELDNSYGKSKKMAEEELKNYSKRNGVSIFIYRLPNIFGKWCKPNYNSVVATFCYNVARNLPISVSDPEKELSLIYIDEVVKEFVACIKKIKKEKSKIINFKKTHKIKLGDLAEKIKSFEEMRWKIHVPKFSDNLTKFLYSTYLSYLPEDSFSIPLISHKDNRGSFTEFVKTLDSGQISISTTNPGEEIVRGNHYHHTKTERFFVVKGKASIKFRNIFSNKIIEYSVSGNEPQSIDVPPGYAHSIKNTGNTEMVLIIWANERFDKENPDTYFFETQ